MVINSKGGSGKTTVSVNLAAYCAQKGYKTSLVDLDPQGSSTQWLKERPLNKALIKGSSKFTKPSNLPPNSLVAFSINSSILSL